MLSFCKTMLTSAKLSCSWYHNLYFLKLLMCVYVRTKFQVSSIVLTSLREAILPTLPPPAKRTPKNPTQIKVNLKTIPNRYSPSFKQNLFVHKSVSWWPTSRINILIIYYKLGQLCFITNWGSLIITKLGRRYDKLGQLLQIEATFITN